MPYKNGEKKMKTKINDIKNRICYHFDGIMKAREIDSSYILLDRKSYKIILIYNIWYKIFRVWIK